MSRENALRLAIKNSLQNISKANSPNIYGMIHNKKGKVIPRGYQIVENKIIKRVIHQNMTITEAIPQLEMELDLR
ncbi:MAG TPA: hypothetical protein P5514_12455 [Bacteroidales bacterium]|nr:hypothetical protein [Bacteroidales bacterium]HRX97750.1 hypothetical protein [Bacteroidales bacterium]